jgi:hypothetical protein
MKPIVEETVTITKEKYDSLVLDSLWLGALEAAGVDNWEGYDFAHDHYKDALAEAGVKDPNMGDDEDEQHKRFIN